MKTHRFFLNSVYIWQPEGNYERNQLSFSILAAFCPWCSFLASVESSTHHFYWFGFTLMGNKKTIGHSYLYWMWRFYFSLSHSCPYPISTSSFDNITNFFLRPLSWMHAGTASSRQKISFLFQLTDLKTVNSGSFHYSLVFYLQYPLYWFYSLGLFNRNQWIPENCWHNFVHLGLSGFSGKERA